MRIIVFGGHYHPDLGPSAPIFTMLCENLAKLGHQVTMVTMVPHYPTGRVFPEYRGRLVWKSVENGVEVIRVGLPSLDRTRLPFRMLQFVIYQLGVWLSTLGKPYDAVYAGGAGISAWFPFLMLVGLPKKPAIYSVYDVYPDVGIKLGIFRHRWVIALVAAVEKICLHNATLVRIISDSFRPALRNLGVPDEKMVMVYDWVDTDLVRPLSRDNDFAREYGLTGKFVIMYAGNIGLSQGLENVLAAAASLADHEDILFVFVGDGANRERLVAESERLQLRNVRFIPFQPRERLPQVLASADVSLVSLQHGIGHGSLPSKTYSILASGRPVIASVDEDSEPWKLIRLAEAGVCIQPEDPAALAQAILHLRADPALCEQLGRNGRAWAEKVHSPQAGAREIEKLLQKAIALKTAHQG
ncbi:MAG: glycosyltransferase family 4 protein [Anaerolineales bacterium]